MTPALLLAVGLAVTPVDTTYTNEPLDFVQDTSSNPCISPVVPTIQLLSAMEHDGFKDVAKAQINPRVWTHWLVNSKGEWAQVLVDGEASCIMAGGTHYEATKLVPDAPLSPPTSVPSNPPAPSAGPLVAPPGVPSVSPEGEIINL